MQVTPTMFDRSVSWLRRAGPYLLLELLLPGGTLLAILLWFSGGSSRGQFADVQRLSMPAIAFERVVSVCRSA
jgi:hypothetical protein